MNSTDLFTSVQTAWTRCAGIFLPFNNLSPLKLSQKCMYQVDTINMNNNFLQTFCWIENGLPRIRLNIYKDEIEIHKIPHFNLILFDLKTRFRVIKLILQAFHY